MEQKHIVIDCDVEPFVPMGWYVLIHAKGGKLVWDPGNFELETKIREDEIEIAGEELIQRFERESSLNATVLDFLFANQHLIPTEWKGKCILFAGTIYEFMRPFKNQRSYFCVRFLVWTGEGWTIGFRWLGSKFSNYHNVIVRKI